MSWEATWLSVRILVIASSVLSADLLANQKAWRSFVPPLGMLCVFQPLLDPSAPGWPHPQAAIAALALWVLALGATGEHRVGFRSWALMASGMAGISLEV